MRAPIAAYAGMLCAMFAGSTTLSPSMPIAARRRILAGTSPFLLSESLLGIPELIRDDDSHTLDAVVMATDTVGQLLMAEGGVATPDARGPDRQPAGPADTTRAGPALGGPALVSSPRRRLRVE
jgi:hypothetical protein